MKWTKKKALDDTLKAMIANGDISKDQGGRALKLNRQMWNTWKKKKYSKSVKKVRSIIKKIKNKAQSGSYKTLALEQADCLLETLNKFYV